MAPDIEPRHPIEEPTTELEHVTIENDDAPDECVIFPQGAGDGDHGSAWLIAHGNGFVSLDSMR